MTRNIQGKGKNTFLENVTLPLASSVGSWAIYFFGLSWKAEGRPGVLAFMGMSWFGVGLA
jgi:hypothetical protein